MEPFCQENSSTSFKQVRKLFKEQIGKDIFDVFDYFEELPIASGSIAQVHKARLANTFEYVAVKVQHPKIITQTKGDFHVVRLSCNLGEYFFPGVKLSWIYNDFVQNMTQEVDFIKEAENIRKARKLFKSEKNVIIPRVYGSLSSNRILTMSFEQGKSVTDLEYLKKNKISPNVVSKMMNHFFNRQIFIYGFVHADPHQGNVFVRKELNEKGFPVLKLILLDFGLFMELNDNVKNSYSNLWRGIYLQNEKIIKDACDNLGVKEAEVFTSMVTGKAYKDLMNKQRKNDFDSRLKIKKGIL
jgi:aarF domain-containing kinase